MFRSRWARALFPVVSVVLAAAILVATAITPQFAFGQISRPTANPTFPTSVTSPKVCVGTDCTDYFDRQSGRIHSTDGVIADTGGFCVSANNGQCLVGSGNNTVLQFANGGNLIIEESSGGADSLSINTTQIGTVLPVNSYVEANSNGFALTVDQARIDLGTGSADYLFSDGSAIKAAGSFQAADLYGTVVAVGATGIIGNGTNFLFINPGTTGSPPIAGVGTCFGNNTGSECDGVTAAATHIVTRSTLATCSATIEGAVSTDVLSGLATGKRTKLCLCTSDGASAYKWQNLATGTLGTTTTCGTE